MAPSLRHPPGPHRVPRRVPPGGTAPGRPPDDTADLPALAAGVARDDRRGALRLRRMGGKWGESLGRFFEVGFERENKIGWEGNLVCR